MKKDKIKLKKLFLLDNSTWPPPITLGGIDLIYADMIYENLDFVWITICTHLLKVGGIFIIQTDYHSVAQVKLFLDELGLNFINWCIYKQEWGGISRRYFPRKHDDILIYSVGKEYKFYPKRIMIPKVTAGTALDKNGGKKIPCDVFDDLGNFMTTSKERIKLHGKNVQWQKPLKLMNRLLLPFTDPGDLVYDPFMGTGSTGEWCLRNNRNFIGMENNKEIFQLAEDRLERVEKEMI